MFVPAGGLLGFLKCAPDVLNLLLVSWYIRHAAFRNVLLAAPRPASKDPAGLGRWADKGNKRFLSINNKNPDL